MVEGDRRISVVRDTLAAIAGALGGDKAVTPYLEALEDSAK